MNYTRSKRICMREWNYAISDCRITIALFAHFVSRRRSIFFRKKKKEKKKKKSGQYTLPFNYFKTRSLIRISEDRRVPWSSI